MVMPQEAAWFSICLNCAYLAHEYLATEKFWYGVEVVGLVPECCGKL
jgi:hypothetical protein